MSKASKKTNVLIYTLAGSILTLILVLTYVHFFNFKPAQTIETPEVQGVATNSQSAKFDIPLPKDIWIVSDDQTQESRSITFITSQTHGDIHKYYETILLSEGWKVDIKGGRPKSFISVYKKEAEEFIVRTFIEQSENTQKEIVGIVKLSLGSH